MTTNQDFDPDATLLDASDLSVEFDTDAGTLVAVDGVDFRVREGETVCLVGESGSGKTVATESITRLIQEPPGRIDGSVEFRGRDLLEMADRELRAVRGNRIAHIFQNPQEAMNHTFTVGWQIAEAIQVHEDVPDAEARARAVDLLDRVGIDNASARFDDYPHEFSGGQKQRVMIAMALVGNPDLLLADEPTTALDVTVQAQILRLLEDLQEEFGMGILFVTHDLGVVAEIADRVVVMYAGKVMERGDVYRIFEKPAHPYTQALMRCLPGRSDDSGGIPGSLPDPTDPPSGCRFAERCEHAIEACTVGKQPPEFPVEDGHSASCVYYGSGYDSTVVADVDIETDETTAQEATDD
ncbi:ABC transporter ATP-binding protein [Halapricum desulfuricans]|uniref:Nickel import system ATP-binding protein NikD n=1 Tax=Halapricum desulfuricans TaxID=2841257 RepID=A0A897MTI8_9EURY|nr:ABC transporter ATP-binding protein [Halapricum desulfuricans]QSG05450.1 ABC-type dipeptide/oligopeptide/nickel transportsystem, ATPase component [Halapricum desulfuricans]